MKVVCGGMYRSGSTWQYNAVRLIMQQAELLDVYCGYNDEGGTERQMTEENYVIKAHKFRPDFLSADVILTSFRDLRDVVASLYRKRKIEPHLHVAIDAFDRFQGFLPFATHVMRYETMINDQLTEIEHLARILKLDTDPKRIYHELQIAKYDEKNAIAVNETETIDKETLLWPNHMTDGRHGSWVDSIPEDVAKQIEKHFKDWMHDNRYIN